MSDALPVDVLVMGAGTIGCYVGGCLAAAGVRVAFVGRPRMLDAMEAHGLTLTDLDGARRHVPAGSLLMGNHVPFGVRPALVLLTVKSAATYEAAAELAEVLPFDTPVISLQNGVSNVAVASKVAPNLRIIAGMVPYNVAELSPGHFHRGTAGRIAVKDDPALRRWTAVFDRAGVPLDAHGNLVAIQWGKLLFNLNNPVNALSGLPLREELLQRGYRRCFAALMDEALAVLKRAGIEPAALPPAPPPHRIPGVLRLPTPLFRWVARRMLRIDAKARSSMADDLALGRRTEIDAFCGEVVRMAQAQGTEAPRNAKMLALVAAWPEAPTAWTAQQLLVELGL